MFETSSGCPLRVGLYFRHHRLPPRTGRIPNPVLSACSRSLQRPAQLGDCRPRVLAVRLLAPTWCLGAGIRSCGWSLVACRRPIDFVANRSERSNHRCEVHPRALLECLHEFDAESCRRLISWSVDLHSIISVVCSRNRLGALLSRGARYSENRAGCAGVSRWLDRSNQHREGRVNLRGLGDAPVSRDDPSG
jgi:hypothetical protein